MGEALGLEGAPVINKSTRARGIVMHIRQQKFFATLAASALLWGMTVGMAPQGGIVAEQIVETERTVKLPDGTVKTERVPAELVKPGDKIFYTLVFKNEGDKAAEDIVLTMPVPAEITYIENSAEAGEAKVIFSADGGKSFAPRGSLVVSIGGEKHPAESQDVTHIRWVMSTSIEPGVEHKLSFAGTLK